MKSHDTRRGSLLTRLFTGAVAGAALFTLSSPSFGAEPTPAAIAHYNIRSDKVALKGYDPVSYFAQNQPVKGKGQFSASYGGVLYYFASEENKRLFEKSPENYLPSYGGWCATAMAKGDKVDINPASYKITDGRLFLFYKGVFGNALKDWNKDEATLTPKADTHWKRIAGE